MENYIVSARKYRPATFDTVVGQRALTTTLKNAIANQKLAHAYLFCGPRGVGKTTCARIFAKTINCLHPTADGEACNECESCRAFNEQRSYNIHELDAASNNSVEDIRSLIEQVRIPPQIGKYKVLCFKDVDKDYVKDMITGEEGKTGLPKSNVLYYQLENNSWCCVRPSGTEPKIKLYFGVKGTSAENATEELELLKDAMVKTVKE